MTQTDLFGRETLALHAGQSPDPVHGSRATPIHFTTSYVFSDADQAAALFNLERPGHVYSRISNPTTAVLEERVAALEGGVGAIALASGQAALHLAITTLMGAGGHIVASRALYGGSHNLLGYTLPRFGIHTTSSIRTTSTPGAPPSGRKPGCCSANQSATPGWTCSTSRRWLPSPTNTSCRC